jgi:hypothetical protein
MALASAALEKPQGTPTHLVFERKKYIFDALET